MIEKIKNTKKRTWFRLILIVLLLYSLHLAGVPPLILGVFAILYITLFALRGKVRSTIEKKLHIHIPGFKEWPGWARTALMFIVLIIVYMILKQIIFYGLSIVGINMQEIIMNAMNVTSYDS